MIEPLDRVIVSPHLAEIDIGARQTEDRAAPYGSRLAVHCRIAVSELTWLGWEISADKIICGKGMLLLGTILNNACAQSIKCPRIKREWLEYAIAGIGQGLRDSARVDVDMVKKMTGRLTILSQYFPELRHPLGAGYSLSKQGEAGESSQTSPTWAAMAPAQFG